MINNLTMLMLTEDEVNRLNSIGRTDITNLNYSEVPVAVKAVAMAELSKFGCDEVRVLHFSFEEWEALEGSEYEFFQSLNGKVVGLKYFNEVKRRVRKLLEEKRENTVEC